MFRIVHFDITAEDIDKVIRFYETVFDWEFKKWSGPFDYWLIKTGENSEPGINGGLSRREDRTGWQNTINVKDIDKVVSEVISAGGEIVQPKAPVPGVGWFVLVRDPEGNEFGMMEDDPRAG